MKHIGFLLILIVYCNAVDLFRGHESVILKSKNFSIKSIPTWAAFVVFAFLELIYWIAYIFIL